MGWQGRNGGATLIQPVQYRIDKDAQGNWDIIVTHPDGSTVGLNNGEPCICLEELAMFLDELDEGELIPIPAVRQLRADLAALSQG